MRIRGGGGVGLVVAAFLTLLGTATAYVHTNLEQLRRLATSNLVVVRVNSVPAPLAAAGWDGNAMGARLGEAVRGLEDGVATALGPDVVTSDLDRGIVPRAVVPGTSLGADAVLRMARRAAGRHEIFVDVDFALPLNGDGSVRRGSVQAFVRITRDGEVKALEPLTGSTADLPGLMRTAAKSLLPSINGYLWAKHLSDTERKPEALSALGLVVRNASGRELAEAYNLRGVILNQLEGGSEDPRSSFRRAIQVDPSFILPYLNLSDQLAKSGQTAASLELLRDAVQANPESGLARVSYGMALAKEGKRAAAIEQYRRAALPWPGMEDRLPFTKGLLDGTLACSPFDVNSSAAALVAWGRLIEESGDTTEARRLYLKALECGADGGHSHVALADSFLASGEAAPAVVLYREAVERDGPTAHVLAGWGSALTGLNRPAEAMVLFRDALERFSIPWQS